MHVVLSHEDQSALHASDVSLQTECLLTLHLQNSCVETANKKGYNEVDEADAQKRQYARYTAIDL